MHHTHTYIVVNKRMYNTYININMDRSDFLCRSECELSFCESDVEYEAYPTENVLSSWLHVHEPVG